MIRKTFLPETSSIRNADTITFPLSIIPSPRTETEDYLRQSVVNIIDILNKPNTQLPFLTYGDTTTSAIDANLLQHTSPRAPSSTQTPDTNPTPTLTPAPPVIVPGPLLLPEPIPMIFPTVRYTMTPAKVQRGPLKSPGGGGCLSHPENHRF